MTRDERDKIVKGLANYRLKGKTRWDIVNALDSVVEGVVTVCFNDDAFNCTHNDDSCTRCSADPETCGRSEPLHKDRASTAIDHIQTLRDFYSGCSLNGITLDLEIDAIEQELEAKGKEINSLRGLCSQAYQIAGVLSCEMDNDRLEPLMDNLSVGAKGGDLPHKQLLPFNPCDKESNMYHQVLEDDGKTPVDWKVEYFIDDGNSHKQKMGAGKHIRSLKKELKVKGKKIKSLNSAIDGIYKMKHKSDDKYREEIERLAEENTVLKKEKNYTVNSYYEKYIESYVHDYQKDIEELKAKLSKIKDIL